MVNAQAATLVPALVVAEPRSSQVVWMSQRAIAAVYQWDALFQFHSQLHCLFSDALCTRHSEEHGMVGH